MARLLCYVRVKVACKSDQPKGGYLAITVTLYIDSTIDANQVVNMGGRVVRWEPAASGAPALATFAFKNPARFDKFLADALAIRGVALYHSGDSIDANPD